jgi:hypothetical protein
LIVIRLFRRQPEPSDAPTDGCTAAASKGLPAIGRDANSRARPRAINPRSIRDQTML